MSMVLVDVIAASREESIERRRSSLVFSFLEGRNRVAFILDSDRRPTIEDIMKSAVSVDVRTLRSEDIEGGDPIHFNEMQMKVVRLLVELYFEIQAIKEDLIRNPGTDGYRYRPETVWKLRCTRINADIANRWMTEDLPDVVFPEIDVVIAFINHEYEAMQDERDREAHRNFAVWYQG